MWSIDFTVTNKAELLSLVLTLSISISFPSDYSLGIVPINLYLAPGSSSCWPINTQC